MGEIRTTKQDAEKVYRLYRDDPEAGRSSYLHDHYRRGREGIMEPDRQALRAHAAWRAGRDAVNAGGSE